MQALHPDMYHHRFNQRGTPESHPPALFRLAMAGPPRFSVRLLDAFDAEDALALAREDSRPGQQQALRQLQREVDIARARTGQPRPWPLLLLDANASPAMLLPLLLWRPSSPPGRAGLRTLATLAAPASHPHFNPPRRADWQMTVLQARAMLHAITAMLPDEVDVLFCRALPANQDLDETALHRLLVHGNDAGAHPLPGCATIHPLSWRGMLALLRARLRGLPGRA